MRPVVWEYGLPIWQMVWLKFCQKLGIGQANCIGKCYHIIWCDKSVESN